MCVLTVLVSHWGSLRCVLLLHPSVVVCHSMLMHMATIRMVIIAAVVVALVSVVAMVALVSMVTMVSVGLVVVLMVVVPVVVPLIAMPVVVSIKECSIWPCSSNTNGNAGVICCITAMLNKKVLNKNVCGLLLPLCIDACSARQKY